MSYSRLSANDSSKTNLQKSKDIKDSKTHVLKPSYDPYGYISVCVFSRNLLNMQLNNATRQPFRASLCFGERSTYNASSIVLLPERNTQSPINLFCSRCWGKVFFEVEALEADTNVSLKGGKLTQHTALCRYGQIHFMGRSVWSRTTASRHFCGRCVSP
jgi:hypothetical protein